MPRGADAGGVQQAPEIDEIGADAHLIPGQDIRPYNIARQPMCRLVNANDKMIGETRCKVQCRQADPAAGIYDQRRTSRFTPCRHAEVERLLVVGGNRFAEFGAGVPGDDCRELLMDAALRTGDGTRIGMHIGLLSYPRTRRY